MPLNALNRTLTWGDFTRRNLPAPAPGIVAHIATTSVSFNRAPLRFIPVPGSTPQRFRLNVEPTVTVNFDRAQSWVASYLFTLSQAEQDAMLDHEQSHYLILALSARDIFNELLAIQQLDYPTTAAGIADVQAVEARFTPALIQAIQDKYDKDTNHDPLRNQMLQTLWSGILQGAKMHNVPLRDYLRRATLIP